MTQLDRQIIIDNIKKLYENDDIQQIIERNVFLFKSALDLGFNIMDCYLRTHDLGIKPNEMGISVAIALKQTDDSKLSKTDVAIKQKILLENSEALKSWEEGLL